MKYDLNEGSRSKQRGKKRKTNIILNSLIGIVTLLIIIVGISIFTGGNENTSKEQVSSEVEEKNQTDELADGKSDDIQQQDEETIIDNMEKEEDSLSDLDDISEENQDEISKENEDIVVTDGGSSPYVKSTIVNPAWEPIGTTQTGEHVASYDENSADWNEMKKTLSYATGLSEDQMTIWFLGNNGSPNKAVGTVTSKDQKQIYRVQIDWIDQKGWKPVLVEELTKEALNN